jgi:Tubulin-tyrosine ligase family
MWIVKPASLNQGRGIEIFSSANDIQKFILSKPLNSQWVIQKYIERPLLFKKRKFDLRIWALVTDDGDVYLTIVILLPAWIYAHVKRGVYHTKYTEMGSSY